MEPSAILNVDADIFSPCAVGGILDAGNIPGPEVPDGHGTGEQRPEGVQPGRGACPRGLLAARGVLYQVEWRHNIAGVMAGYEEYVHQQNASMERLMEKVGALCTEKPWENLNEAKREGITPTKRAHMAAEREVYGE